MDGEGHGRMLTMKKEGIITEDWQMNWTEPQTRPGENILIAYAPRSQNFKEDGITI